jgi:hypothetical protein
MGTHYIKWLDIVERPATPVFYLRQRKKDGKYFMFCICMWLKIQVN